MEIGNQMLAESKFYMGYSRWVDSEHRYETWEESVSRVMNMHREKYKAIMTPELEDLIQYAQDAYNEKLVLGAQRALQFGGEQIFKHETRLYNCSASYCDRPAFFSESFYLGLSGVGVGFSVQKKNIDKLPQIARRSHKKSKVFTIPDSIEGWADSIGVLLSSYFVDGGTHPEYKGCQVRFDYSKIRPKGAMISGGFKAPGPEGLRNALIKCEDLLENILADHHVTNITPIVAYDLVMFVSDAVLSGGVRRCLPGDTLVQIGKDSWKDIKDITIEDRVYVFDEFQTIKTKMVQGEQKVYKIDLGDGKFVESTENHRWFVYDAEKDQMGWVMTKDLKEYHAFTENAMAIACDTKLVKLNFVRSVEFSRITETYDIEIDSHEHAFIAKHPESGFAAISHNSATICLFDKDDQAMLSAKTGNWFIENPQRGRSNNSAIIVRDDLSRDEWATIMKSVKDFGEPGFIFAEFEDLLFNPCVTGDTLVTVCDRTTRDEQNDKIISLGAPYQIHMKTLVELYETSKSLTWLRYEAPPVIISYNIKSGQLEYDTLKAAALTRKSADILELEIEDGTKIKLTPDHNVWTETRGWVEAKDLLLTDVILKLE